MTNGNISEPLSQRTMQIAQRLWEFTAKLQSQADGEVGLKRLVWETARDIESIEPGKWLTEREAEIMYPVFSAKWLRKARYTGEGPPYYKMGDYRNGRVFYKPLDLEAYLEKHRLTPSQDE